MADDWKDFNKRLIADFRANGGKASDAFPMFAGAPLTVLHTTGAKSGQLREIPLVYTEDGDRVVVIASKGGAPENPDWYYNLKAHPEITVELGRPDGDGIETFAGRAAEQSGAERDRLYDAQAEKMPNFAEYQRNTDRKIPLFVIERVG